MYKPSDMVDVDLPAALVEGPAIDRRCNWSLPSESVCSTGHACGALQRGTGLSRWRSAACATCCALRQPDPPSHRRLSLVTAINICVKCAIRMVSICFEATREDHPPDVHRTPFSASSGSDDRVTARSPAEDQGDQRTPDAAVGSADEGEGGDKWAPPSRPVAEVQARCSPDRAARQAAPRSTRRRAEGQADLNTARRIRSRRGAPRASAAGRSTATTVVEEVAGGKGAAGGALQPRPHPTVKIPEGLLAKAQVKLDTAPGASRANSSSARWP